jgi:hypothetical protein
MQSGRKFRENKLAGSKRIEKTHQIMAAKIFRLVYPIHHVEPQLL